MKTMKNLIFALLAAALLAGTGMVSGKNPAKGPTAAKLDRIVQAHGELTRELSYKTWERCLEVAARTQTMVDLSKLKNIRLRALCDTVPALKSLWEADSVAYARWKQALRTDPEYESIHDEFISLRGVNDRKANDANTQRYNLLYERLKQNNPEYIPARDANSVARYQRDEAIARYLLAYYRSQGEVFSTDVIPRTQLWALRMDFSEIAAMEQEQAILLKLQKELREQFLREQYDVKPQANADEKGTQYTGAASAH